MPNSPSNRRQLNIRSMDVRVLEIYEPPKPFRTPTLILYTTNYLCVDKVFFIGMESRLENAPTRG